MEHAAEIVTYTARGTVDSGIAIDDYLPMVRREALRLLTRVPPSVELDDLVQAGTLGLIESARHFDASAGASFRTFSMRRVRGAMYDELRTRDWMPRKVRRKARQVENTIRDIEMRTGSAPSDTEIATAMGVSLASYHQLLLDTNNGCVLSLDALAENGLEPASADSVSDAASRAQTTAALTAAVEALPEREKRVLALHYQEELGLQEIADLLGVTESRVCQIHSQALARLRSKLSISPPSDDKQEMSVDDQRADSARRPVAPKESH